MGWNCIYEIIPDLLEEYNNDYTIKYFEKRIKEKELELNDNLSKLAEEIKKIVEKRDKYIDDVYKELKFRDLI